MSYREVKLRRDENENPVQTDFISLMPGGSLSAYLKQYSLGKGFQAIISPGPGTQESLRCDYIETLLQSTCAYEGGFCS